jgi:GTP pyrophosphokinase
LIADSEPYSVWKKMQKKSISFEKLLDIVAFRIITKNLQDCYKVLGCVNSSYVMIPDTFKDYISKPKLNGYQSLHLAIVGPGLVKMEIQIRTEEMNIIAEYGVASHWMYKQNIARESSLKQYNYIKELVLNLQNTDYNLENSKVSTYKIYEDEVFCYTPNGDIINLPNGSSGLDFAFAIHKDVGSKCSGIRINGIFTQFKTKLKSADEVEILMSKTIQIHEDWLNYVVTTKAKQEIRQYIRILRQKELEKIGRKYAENWELEFNIKITDELIEKKITNFNKGKTIEEIYALLAEDKIKKRDFLDILFPELEKRKIKEGLILKKRIKIETNNNLSIKELDRNTAYKYAKCCYPIPPDEIVGVINNGRGITIHKKNCSLLKIIKKERILDLEWNLSSGERYITKILIITKVKDNILTKIVNILTDKKMPLVGINIMNKTDYFYEIEVKTEAKNNEEVENLKSSLRSSQEIIEVE